MGNRLGLCEQISAAFSAAASAAECMTARCRANCCGAACSVLSSTFCPVHRQPPPTPDSDCCDIDWLLHEAGAEPCRQRHRQGLLMSATTADPGNRRRPK